ncbi:hypothetical protein EDD85DRAFT_796567 [Armillaria nabsnona]|nr:hypothetical protein EDD85DRAFT_796567 [Armillaria nabsnona]
MMKSISNPDQAPKVRAQINNVITPFDQIPTKSSFPFTTIIRLRILCPLFLRSTTNQRPPLRGKAVPSYVASVFKQVGRHCLGSVLSYEPIIVVSLFSTGSVIGRKDQMLAYHKGCVLFSCIGRKLPGGRYIDISWMLSAWSKHAWISRIQGEKRRLQCWRGYCRFVPVAGFSVWVMVHETPDLPIIFMSIEGWPVVWCLAEGIWLVIEE